MPKRLKTLLDRPATERITIGCSDSDVYFIKDLDCYLKVVNKGSRVNLRLEKEKLEWLDRRFCVPKVVDFELFEGKSYLLMTSVTGQDSINYYLQKQNSLELLKIITQKLKELHHISIEKCPYSQNLEIKLNQVKRNIANNWVEEAEFENEYKEKSVGEMYDLLISSLPTSEDLVFTHGDFCLPNIIINNQKISGLIDWEFGGIADRYQDIALLFRSFNHNIGVVKWFEEVFCEEYGIKKINWDKIRFYILLDEFF